MLECAHGCSNETGTPSCTCNPGYSLLSDGKNCEGEEEKEREGKREERERKRGKGQKCEEDKFKILYVTFSIIFIFSDINECAVSSFCSHGCHNTNGGFYCNCPSGLFLNSDRRTCIGKTNKILSVFFKNLIFL